MYQRILLPTDFSVNARRLMPVAIRLAHTFGAEVLLMHVDEEERLFGPRSSDEMVRFVRDIQLRRNEWMERLAEEIRAEGVACRPLRANGLASDEILAAIDKHEVDLVALPLIGAEGAKRILVGSTAKKVLRNSPCDALTIAAAFESDDQPPARRILCPYDFSEMAAARLPRVMRIADEMDAEVVLLKVLKVPSLIPSLPGEPPVVLPRDALDVIVADRLADLEEVVERYVGQRASPTVTIGADEAEAIVAYAKEQPFDLVVIPRAGEGALERFFFGRVSHAVAKLSPVPVLTLA